VRFVTTDPRRSPRFVTTDPRRSPRFVTTDLRRSPCASSSPTCGVARVAPQRPLRRCPSASPSAKLTTSLPS